MPVYVFDNWVPATVKQWELRGTWADYPQACRGTVQMSLLDCSLPGETGYRISRPQRLRFPMKLFVKTCLSLCAVVALATPANACCLFPFGGWWGAGYNAAPAYSSYYAPPSYTSYYGSPSYSSFYSAGSVMAPMSGCCGSAAPAYAASYGSYGSYGAGCCTNSCCDSCGSSGCASGSCVGTEPVGSLKPASDPNFNKSKTNYDDEPRTREFPSDTTRPRSRSNETDLDPADDPLRKDRFTRPAGGGSGTDTDTEKDLFPVDDLEFGRDRLNNKPPMDDPLDGTSIDPIDETLGTPTDEKTFFEGGKSNPNEVSRRRDTVIARTSSLSEVIAPKRLASRSLPSTIRTVSDSKVAGKIDGRKADTQQPLRWISAPLPAGHVSL